MINRDRLVKTFCEMAVIDSPSYEEDAMAAWATKKLESLGFKVHADSYGNLIASDGRPNPFMLSGHLDTVEPGRGIKPKVDGDRIVSDGTTIVGGDDKAGLTIIFETLESMKEDGKKWIPLEVVLSRAEEPGLQGANHLDFSKIKSKQAIVFDREGPVNRITSVSPSYVAYDVNITGKAAHAGIEPENGIPAIRIAAEIITRLPQGRLNAETTFNVSLIQGGSTRNTVPENTKIEGEFRTTDLETLASLKIDVQDAVAKVQKMYPQAKLETVFTPKFDTFRIKPEHPTTKLVTDALKKIGLMPDFRTSGGGSDANVFWQKGISAVVMGMADYNMHTVREYVNIPEIMQACKLCETIIREG